MTNNRPPASDRLTGWKDIAAYLGKSVRSAQRWEAELGLPVDRLSGPDGGQIVQASRQAIDAWMRRRMADVAADATTGEESDEAADIVEGGSPAPSPDLPRPPRPAIELTRRIAQPLALLLAGAAAGAALTVALTPVIVNPTSFEINGRRILATTDSGRLVWSHELPGAASYPSQLVSSRPDEGDLDGDGSFEIAVGVSYVYRLRAIRDQFTAEVDVGAGRFEMYRFARSFALLEHRFLPQYDLVHREQERLGGLTHPLDACPERRSPRRVLWWNPGAGWIDREPTLETARAGTR